MDLYEYIVWFVHLDLGAHPPTILHTTLPAHSPVAVTTAECAAREGEEEAATTPALREEVGVDQGPVRKGGGV
jgi:hypothetical protein